MFKNSVLLVLCISSLSAFASKPLELHHAPLNSISRFQIVNDMTSLRSTSKSTMPDTLQQINQTRADNKTIIRYQQFHHNIPVVGAQIMVSQDNKDLTANGHLVDDIQASIKPQLSTQEALQIAKQYFLQNNPQAPIFDETSQLQLRPNLQEELSLVYLVSFKSVKDNNKPSWLVFLVDAQTGAINKQWNNVKTYSDIGPGGNEKVHEYWYGRDGLPPLEVTQMGNVCILESSKVRLVDLKSSWDWSNLQRTPLQYLCNNNIEENVNGAFSPSNDAYYFGHIIVDMYRNWYNLPALQQLSGEPAQLIMRVHFGQYFDNAFWDGQSMSFGDGYELYPLVSLDIAGHEVTHGFTEQHSNLEYHDQSGALNESISDMAGQAARAYLLATNPSLYNRAYLVPNVVTWGIGETIMRGSETAIRFMDNPSSDGMSADCLDQTLARQNGGNCSISYLDVVNFAEQRIGNPEEQQSFIVHSASGIFNKAFYLLSQSMGIKAAYQVMVLANIKYWTPTTDFTNGACGILYAANDLHSDLNLFKTVFSQVGVSTKSCLI